MKPNQNKLIEDNINLAYDLTWKYYRKLLGNIEFDELQSICFLGLTKAANTYNPETGIKFTTYAYTVIKNTVCANVTKLKRQSETVSISQSIGDDFILEDTITSDFNISQLVENKIRYEKLYKYIAKLDKQDKLLILGYLHELSTQEIASKLNMTQRQVNYHYHRILNKLRVMYMRGGDLDWEI